MIQYHITVMCVKNCLKSPLLPIVRNIQGPRSHLSPGPILGNTLSTLCRVYAIAVAIPVSSSTAERSFSALKRVKTRIRSSMIQERLAESLLAKVIERKILLSLDKECLINLYAGISPELSKTLLQNYVKVFDLSSYSCRYGLWTIDNRTDETKLCCLLAKLLLLGRCKASWGEPKLNGVCLYLYIRMAL